MKRIIMCIILLVVFPLFQTYAETIDYVDKANAEKEIVDKKAENRELANTIGRLNNENISINKQLDNNYGSLLKIYNMLIDVEAKMKEIEAILNNAPDDGFKANIQDIYNKNNDLHSVLKEKESELLTAIDEDKKKLEENIKQMAESKNGIEANKERIAYLEVALEKTESQEKQLSFYLKNAEVFLNNLTKETKALEKNEAAADPETDAKTE